MLAAAGLCLAGCNQPSPKDAGEEAATPTDRPVRKPGLWRQSLLIGDAAYVQDVKLCLDAEAEEKISWWGKSGLRSGCVEDDIVSAFKN